MNIPTHFTVDCKEAGPGKLTNITFRHFHVSFTLYLQEIFQLP